MQTRWLVVAQGAGAGGLDVRDRLGNGRVVYVFSGCAKLEGRRKYRGVECAAGQAVIKWRSDNSTAACGCRNAGDYWDG